MLSFTPHEYEAPIPESLTRGGLIGVRGFPDGKPLSPRSLPRVRLPGLFFQTTQIPFRCSNCQISNFQMASVSTL